MATLLTPISSIAGTASGGAMTATNLNAAAFATALTAGTNVQFNFANNGAMLPVILNSAAAGGATFSVTIQRSTLGFTFASTTVEYTTPSTVGSYVLGPFGPSIFNDGNGLCWVTQVTASATTSFIGLFTLPGALT